MYFYVFINVKTKWVYGNYSKNPNKSIKAHLTRANNPKSKNYNTLFHKELRQHRDNFIYLIYNDKPDFIQNLHSYGPVKLSQ